MFQFRLDLQLLHFLFEQSEEIEEIEMIGRERKKNGRKLYTNRNTHAYTVHTQTEARTHKLTKQQKKARGCLDILKVGNTGGELGLGDQEYGRDIIQHTLSTIPTFTAAVLLILQN